MIGKIRYGFSIRLAALALATLCFTQLNLRAQGQFPTETIRMTYGVVSVGYGQTLRLNLTYAVDPTQAGQLPLAIRVMAQFKDTSGNTIYVSTAGGGVWKTVNGGLSCSFDVNRDQLPLAGNPRTGAVAMVPELVIEAQAGMEVDFPVSLEVADNLSGKIGFHYGKFVTLQQTDATGSVYTVTFQGSLCGVSHGETLQVNLTNPLPPTLANQTVAGAGYNLKIKSTDGAVLGARNGTVRAGQTIVAGFNRDQLTAAGEPSTGRLPLAVEITYRLTLTPAQLAALGNAPRFPASLEFVDNQTGKTTAYSPVTLTWTVRNSNTP